MKKNIYLVYEGDAWLSTDSLVLMGVYDDFGTAVDAILNEMAGSDAFDDENGHDEDSTRRMLEEHYQTQGFDTNYHIKTADMNTWGEI